MDPVCYYALILLGIGIYQPFVPSSAKLYRYQLRNFAKILGALPPFCKKCNLVLFRHDRMRIHYYVYVKYVHLIIYDGHYNRKTVLPNMYYMYI